MSECIVNLLPLTQEEKREFEAIAPDTVHIYAGRRSVTEEQLAQATILLFCVSRRGWGWKNFLAEANAGQGLKFPAAVRIYVTYILPFIVLCVLAVGYWNQFGGA